jgi:putative lipoic acid-binding regulatory protein
MTILFSVLKFLKMSSTKDYEQDNKKINGTLSRNMGKQYIKNFSNMYRNENYKDLTITSMENYMRIKSLLEQKPIKINTREYSYSSEPDVKITLLELPEGSSDYKVNFPAYYPINVMGVKRIPTLITSMLQVLPTVRMDLYNKLLVEAFKEEKKRDLNVVQDALRYFSDNQLFYTYNERIDVVTTYHVYFNPQGISYTEYGKFTSAEYSDWAGRILALG